MPIVVEAGENVSTQVSTTEPIAQETRWPLGLRFTNGCYRTKDVKVRWFARRFPSLAFFSRFAGIIFRCWRQAKRGKYDDAAWGRSSVATLRALERAGVRFEITGINHLAEIEGPCVVVANHTSTLETVVLPGLIQPLRRVTFVVKEGLLTYPIFKHVMASRDPIAVTQTNARHDLRAMLEGGIQRLSEGISLVIFPEGARSPEFNPGRFNKIGVKLAHRAGVPIVPCALETHAWPLGRVYSDLGKIDPRRKVRIAFGPPLTVSGPGREEHDAIVQFILERLRAWDAEDRELLEG